MTDRAAKAADASNIPDGFYLPPPVKIASAKTLSFGDVHVRVPILNATTLSDIINLLTASQEQYLSLQPIAALLEIVDAAVSRWQKPDNPLRKLAEESLPAITGLSPSMIRTALTRHFESWRIEPLRRALQHALGDIRMLDEFRPSGEDPARWVRAVGPRISTHILAGNIPGLGATELLITLLTKSACLCKVSSDEPLLTALFARTLIEVEPRLAGCLAVVWWPGGSREAKGLEEVAFSRSELVTATGSNEAVAAVQQQMAERRLVSTRFIGYSHRVSLSLIGRESIGTREELRAAAKNAAMDVAMYDQQGCLSPHVIYVETGGNHTPHEFARLLGQELNRLEQELPRGPVETKISARLHQVRSMAEIRQADGKVSAVFKSETGTLWTVICDDDATFALSPLHRTIRVKTVGDLNYVIPLLEPWRPHLQAAGLLVSEARRTSLAGALAGVGVNRICPVGALQFPPAGWPQEGRRFIADRVRWVALES